MQDLTTEELNTIIEQCQTTFIETALKLAAAVNELDRRG
jgi:hypothetical protein